MKIMEIELDKQLDLIEDNVNIGKTNLLLVCFQLLAGLLVLFSLSAFILISSANLIVDLLPDATVWKAQELMKVEFLAGSVSADAEIQAYLQEISDRLKAATPMRDIQLKLIYVKDKDVNAYAVPGNMIMVTSALYEEASSENEIAMILAHEQGHFYYRDHLRALGRKMSLLLLTVLVAPSADIGSLLDGLVGGLLLRYSREQEYKADAFGLDLMNKVYGGNAAGVIDFFERLQKKEGTSAKFTAFLSTHPLSSERVAALKENITQNGMKDGTKIPLRIKKVEKAEDSAE